MITNADLVVWWGILAIVTVPFVVGPLTPEEQAVLERMREAARAALRVFAGAKVESWRWLKAAK
jgi:hypothetical protein